MAADSELGLLFKIAADPSLAQDAIAKLQQRVGFLVGEIDAVNKQMASSGGAAAEELAGAQQRYTAQLVMTREQLDALGGSTVALTGEEQAQIQGMLAAQAAHLDVIQANRAEVSSVVQGMEEERAAITARNEQLGAAHPTMMQSFQDLRVFRMLMYSSLGLISFGFYLAEWDKVVGVIQQASLALGGFSMAAQKAWTDAAKVYDQEFSKKLSNQQERFKYWSDQVQSLHAQVKKARADYQQALRAGPIQGVDMQSYLAGMLIHLRALQSQEQTASGMEAKYNAEISQNTQHHKKNAQAAHQHADALAALILQERNEVEQLSIGDSARRQAVASYDAEIRRIDAVTAALKRQKEFTGAEAKKAQEARTLAAEIRDEKLKQIDDKEAARHRALLAGWERDTEHTLDRLDRSIQAHRHKQIAEAAHGAAQARLHPLLGVHGVPSLAGHMTLQNQATLAATAHIDAEARAVWNLKDAFMGLAPVMDQFTREHPALARSMHEFAHGMGAAAAQAIVYGDNVGTAMRKAAAAEIASLAARAMVNALYETAKGFALLFWHPDAAAAAFESAALFGLVGGAAAAASSALGGGGHGGSRASRFTGVGSSARGGEPGTGPAGFATGRDGGKRTNVYISYGTMAPTVAQQQQLMTALNAGGQLGTVRIHSTDSSAIPAPAY